MTTTETRKLEIKTDKFRVAAVNNPGAGGESQMVPVCVLFETTSGGSSFPAQVLHALELTKDEASELSKALAQAVDWIDRGFPTSAT